MRMTLCTADIKVKVVTLAYPVFLLVNLRNEYSVHRSNTQELGRGLQVTRHMVCQAVIMVNRLVTDFWLWFTGQLDTPVF